jgi:hypothetical protein
MVAGGGIGDGTSVLVGGTLVAVGGGTSVAVGGIGVSVGTGVAVGGTGVLVAVGGTGVFVRVGGISVLVGVGGIGVFVLVGARVGTFVGGGRGVFVSDSRGRRVAVGGIRVDVGTAVDVLVGGTGVLESVLVGTSVSVGTKTVTACSVRAAAVSKLATASSTMFNGGSVAGI